MSFLVSEILIFVFAALIVGEILLINKAKDHEQRLTAIENKNQQKANDFLESLKEETVALKKLAERKNA